MFTGIVQELAKVVVCDREPGMLRLGLALSPERRAGLQLGASVAVNGTCLTVARQERDAVGFDVIQESLERTNLGRLQPDDLVNVERSATFADEIGGHRVSGHVSGMARILEVRRSPNNQVVRLGCALDRGGDRGGDRDGDGDGDRGGEGDWLRHLFHKGFVALDGASLTISALERAAGWFEVSLIPETLARTTFGFRGVDDMVNVEVDSETQAVVETVERLFADPQWRARVLATGS